MKTGPQRVQTARVIGLRLTLNLRPNGAFDNYGDDGTGMRVGGRRATWSVGNFDNFDFQMPAIHLRHGLRNDRALFFRCLRSGSLRSDLARQPVSSGGGGAS
jgi:hypothetical protein